VKTRASRPNAGDDDALLIELFVHRRETYDEVTVLRLTRTTAAQLRAAIAEGEVEPIEEAGGRTFAWADVAQLALRRWTPRMISTAVARAGADDALPLLNQTRAIRVELPLYQIRLLHWVAAASSEPGNPPLNVSDVLERQIDALASGTEGSDAVAIECAIRGFRAAFEFPFVEQRPPVVEDSCLYCGSAPPTEGGACTSCAARHDPARPEEVTGDEDIV